MDHYSIHIQLESDAAFGRGDGLAGVVDQEVEHDRYGLPFLRGRTLKGLLVEECANLLFALGEQNQEVALRYHQAADELFGRPGSRLGTLTNLRVGDAHLPDELRAAVQNSVDRGELSPREVVDSLTDIRRQTAMDETGTPEAHSLRATRVVLRSMYFVAPLSFSSDPGDRQLALLAACVKAFRRAGTNRNRGLGRLRAALHDAGGEDVTSQCFQVFAEEVLP